MEERKLQPIFLTAHKKVEKLLKDKPYLTFVDAFKSQVEELFVIDNRQFIGIPKEKYQNSPEFAKFCRKQRYNYLYIYYPWNHSIIKCLKKEDFYRLKTNRNCDLITVQEQTKLHQLTIAVFGLSVGSNISLVLSQAGIGKEFILADMDNLETTNLNRIIAGIHQIGVNKCIINARKILEDNPYINLNILPNGINKNILSNLLNKKKIDIIIDEIDDLPTKIMIRDLVIIYKIPVLMITDNGEESVLIVERYDLGYDKIFQKNRLFWIKKLLPVRTKEDMGKIIDLIIGNDQTNLKMNVSLQKVYGKKLVSWPQIGNTALLGAIVVLRAIQKIFIEHNKDLYLKRKYDVKI